MCGFHRMGRGGRDSNLVMPGIVLQLRGKCLDLRSLLCASHSLLWRLGSVFVQAEIVNRNRAPVHNFHTCCDVQSSDMLFRFSRILYADFSHLQS